MAKDLKILKVTCSRCRTLNLIPWSAIGDEPIKCEKCGKVLVVRGIDDSRKFFIGIESNSNQRKLPFQEQPREIVNVKKS